MIQREVDREINYSYWPAIGLFLLIIVFIIGCSATQSDIQESEGTLAATITAVPPSVTPEPSSTVADTVVPLTSLLPSLTPTTTATATSTRLVMPISSPTAAPTLTPLPTIDPQQRGQVYDDLISNNGGCKLPCWWGFELGRTSLDEVRQFYAALNTNIIKQDGRNGRSALYATFVDPQIENGEQVPHLFRIQDNTVIEAEIQLNHHPSYQIESLLQRLGQPSEVWMWTIPEPYLDKLPADFILYFPDQGILVGYRVGSVMADDAVNVCFDGSGGVTIRLWDPSVWNPNGDKGFVERINESHSSAFRLESYHPIEEVSNWDTEQFYTVLTDPNNTECLETPSNLWPSPY